MLQQLTKEFQTNALFTQQQLAAVNKSLEEAMKALDTREEISIDLEQRDLRLEAACRKSPRT